jgi:hypothetical protein
MGGFAALAFAEKLPVRTAIAFVPRFSPDGRIVRDPRLKAKLRLCRDRFPFRTVVPGLAAAGHALVLHGDQGPDRPHVVKFAMPATAEHWVLPDCGHHVGQRLRTRAALDPVITGALSQDWDKMRTALLSARAGPAAAAVPAIRRALLRERAQRLTPVRLLTAALRRVRAIAYPGQHASLPKDQGPRAKHEGNRHVHHL